LIEFDGLCVIFSAIRNGLQAIRVVDLMF